MTFIFTISFSGIELWVPASVRSEGTKQFGVTTQALFEYDSLYSDPGGATSAISQLKRPIYVDIKSADEKINVSACGNAWADDWKVDIYYVGPQPPSDSNSFTGTLASYPPASGSLLYTGTTIANSSIGTSVNNPNCNVDAQLAVANMTYPVSVTAANGAGVYEVRLQNITNASSPGANNPNSVFRQFDISVTNPINPTPDSPNPTIAQGRIWSYVWTYNTGDFVNGTNQDYYVVVPGGVPGTNFVWKLNLSGFKGFVYEMVANNRGVDSPNSAGVNVRGLSVPIPGNSVTPQYRQYINYPDETFTSPTQRPAISNLRFIDNNEEDDVFTPGITGGVQDTGFFKFTSSLPGTYQIIIDTNQNGVYGAGDVQLRGDTDPVGNVSVLWDGRNNLGEILPVGTYNAEVKAIIGEYHFVAGDVETGGTLTIEEVTPGALSGSALAYWDDITVLGTSGGTSYPDGLTTGHLWGTTYGVITEGRNNDSWGDRRYIDTAVYGDFKVGNVPAIIADAETRDYGDAPDSYGTDKTNSAAEGVGPSQVVSANTLLGTAVTDADSDGQPSATANGDDTNGTTPDDEDGVASFSILTTDATSYSVTVRVKNTPAVAADAYLAGWIDFNKDGIFFASEGVVQTIPNGTNGNVVLTWNGLSGLTVGNTFARFRINNAPLTTSDFIGGTAKGNGEVEDYQITIVAPPSTSDYGDAPDTALNTAAGDYKTTAADGGPSHTVVAGLRLGATVDIDDGTLQNLNADADDINGIGADADDINGIGGTGPDDEDGVTTFPTINTASGQNYTFSNVSVTNTTGADAYLVGYIDFNKDGIFANAAPERSATVTIPNNATTANVVFTGTPADMTAGNTYARFRLSSVQAEAESSIGASGSGEVEDYRISIIDTAAVDWGDAPDGAINTGTDNYRTRDRTETADDGPSHNIIPELRLGAAIDAELGTNAAIQNATATADDTIGTDDEDGVASFPTLTTASGLTYTVPVTFSNTTGGNAYIVGYIDFNRDGDFLDTGEQSTTATVATGATSTNLFFTSPASISAGNAFARIRISSTQSQAESSVGASTSGEVEDYLVPIISIDYGDASGVGAASHTIVANLRLGNTVDAESGILTNANADADDITNTGAVDDEDGLINVPTITTAASQTYYVNVNAFNNTGSDAYLVGYIDFNRDGDFADGGERSARVTVDPNGANSLVLTFTSPASGISAGDTYLRLRLTNTNPLSPTTSYTSGEVEDYKITIVDATASVDYGDAPDASGTGTAASPRRYNTRAANSGASHTIIAGLRLGTQVDADNGTLQNTNADADDLDGTPDDEDAVTSFAPLNTLAGQNYSVDLTVTNTTGTNAYLGGFIDFNQDGDFLDTNEQALSAIPNNATTANINFTTPAGMVVGDTYARFRISSNSAQVTSATGAAFSGEVEDYKIAIVPARDYGDAPDITSGTGSGDYQTTLANGGASHTILSTLKLGANAPDGETGTVSVNPAATADDNIGTPDDEDGVASFDAISTASTSYSVTVNVTNNSGSAGYLVGWIDFNRDGVFASTEAATVLNVPDGTTASDVTLNWSSISGLVAGDSYLHLRLSTDVLTSNDALGAKGNGEVEDYKIAIAQAIDYGDAPDTTGGAAANDYQTTLANGGASHTIVSTLKMGASATDADSGSLQSLNADADDTTGTDDEDGVTLPAINTSTTTYTATVNVTNTAAPAYLVGWIDFNKNGFFEVTEGVAYDSDAGTAGIQPIAISPTAQNLNLQWTGITGLTAGDTYAHFRLSDSATLTTATPNGAVGNGEVEDYKLAITSPSGTPALLLVKRITAVLRDGAILPQAERPGGEDTSVFNNDTGSTNDDVANWPTPNTYLRGATNAGKISPRDEVEYTIYFLNNGGANAKDVNICDVVPDNMTYVPSSMVLFLDNNAPLNSPTAPNVGSPPTPNDGVYLTALGTNPNTLTDSNGDSDRGAYYSPGTAPLPAGLCKEDATPIDGTNNDTGAVVWKVVNNSTTPNNIANATAPGTPANSYGFVRFRAKVK